MHFFKLIFGLAAAGSAFAMPAPETNGTSAVISGAGNDTAVIDVVKGAQSCIATDDWGSVRYNLHIGEPFKHSHCKHLKHKIEIYLGGSWRHCYKTRKHHMAIQFEVPEAGHGHEINKYFNHEFPKVNGFNCPGS